MLRAATAALAAAMLIPLPTAAADTAIIIGGNGIPTPTQEQMDALLGGSLQDDTYVPITWPASAWPVNGTHTIDESVAIGGPLVYDAIMAAEGPVKVVGASQGTIVLANVQRQLAEDPNAPDEVTFIYLAPVNQRTPQTTSLMWHFNGLHIPVVDWTVRGAPTDSPYNTIIVVGEYDGIADFPDRPWNLLAVANASIGMLYLDSNVHGDSVNADLTKVPAANITVTTNSKGATTTTYLVPTHQLPLTRPLRDLGVPGFLVDVVDMLLRPIINMGYRRYDPKPAPKPAAKPTPKPATKPVQADGDGIAETITTVKERVRDSLQADKAEAKPEAKTPDAAPVVKKPKIRDSFKAIPGKVTEPGTKRSAKSDAEPATESVDAETDKPATTIQQKIRDTLNAAKTQARDTDAGDDKTEHQDNE